MSSGNRSGRHKNHTWIPGQPPPEIRPHSVAKHRVLKAYLETYVAVLTGNPRQDQLRLTLVDGFAGGGRYLDSRSNEECAGSPFIMLEAMKVASDVAQAKRSKPFNLDVDYFFVERDGNAIKYLKDLINDSEYRPLSETKIHLVQGDFVSHVTNIIDHIKGRGKAGRSIFVLDQFGYIDAPLPTIRQILQSLPNAEVILTFAVDSLVDYLSTNEQSQGILSKLGLSLSQDLIATAKTSPDWRRIIQFALHKEIPLQTGAAHYTPFFIRSTGAHRDFWLIHLSGHHRARDVMVQLHWNESTHFAHYGRSGLRMLGYDPVQDTKLSGQGMLPGFFFDEAARASSQEELLQQLPEQLHLLEDGITFNNLFGKLTNDTPVTSKIMKEVLGELAAQGIIEIRDKSGAKKKHPNIKSGSDILKVPKQKLFFF